MPIRFANRLMQHVPGNKYLIPGKTGTGFPMHMLRATWFIAKMGVWDSAQSGALVADEMGLGSTFTLVAAVMIYELLTEKVVMWLLLLV